MNTPTSEIDSLFYYGRAIPLTADSVIAFAKEAKALCKKLEKSYNEARVERDQAVAEVGELRRKNETLKAVNALALVALQGQERRHKETVQALEQSGMERERSLSAKCAKLQQALANLQASIGVVESWMPPPPQNLRDDIIRAINCRNAESGSDTPDWILGDFLMNCLTAFNEATVARTTYYATPDDVPAAEPPTAAVDSPAPESCQACNWVNHGLRNFGTTEKSNWLCFGCAARAIQATKE